MSANILKQIRVRISLEMLMGIITQGQVLKAKVVRGIPPDAKFVRITNDLVMGVDFVVTHDSFPELSEGQIIPTFEVILEQVD